MFIIVICHLSFSLRFLCIFKNLASYLFYKTLISILSMRFKLFTSIRPVSPSYFYFYNHFLVLISVILICTMSAAWRENDTTTQILSRTKRRHQHSLNKQCFCHAFKRIKNPSHHNFRDEITK